MERDTDSLDDPFASPKDTFVCLRCNSCKDDSSKNSGPIDTPRLSPAPSRGVEVRIG